MDTMKIILLLFFLGTFVANAIRLKYKENLEKLKLKYMKDRKYLYRKELMMHHTKLSADLKENNKLTNTINQMFRKYLFGNYLFRNYLDMKEQNSKNNDEKEKFIKQIDQTLATESDTKLDFILVKDLHNQLMMLPRNSSGNEFLEKLDELKIKYFKERENIYKKEFDRLERPKYHFDQLMKCLREEEDNAELIRNLIIDQTGKNKFMLTRLLTEFTTDKDELVRALLKYHVLDDNRQCSVDYLEIILQFLRDGAKEKLLLEHKSQNLNYVIDQFDKKCYSKMQALVENVNRKTLTKCMEEITDSGGNGLHVLFAGAKDDHDLQKILNVFLDHPESLMHCLKMENTESLTPYDYIGSHALGAEEIGTKDVEIMHRMVNARKSYAGKMLDDKEFLNHLVVRSMLEKNFGQLKKKDHNFAVLAFGQKNRNYATEDMIDTKRGNKPHLQFMIDKYIYYEKEHVRGINVHEEEEE